MSPNVERLTLATRAPARDVLLMKKQMFFMDDEDEDYEISGKDNLIETRGHTWEDSQSYVVRGKRSLIHC